MADAETVLLEPCPFCGAQMLIREHSAFHPDRTKEEQDCVLAGSDMYEIGEVEYPAWNRRPAASRAPQEENRIIAGLKDALAFANGDTSKGTLYRMTPPKEMHETLMADEETVKLVEEVNDLMLRLQALDDASGYRQPEIGQAIVMFQRLTAASRAPQADVYTRVQLEELSVIQMAAGIGVELGPIAKRAADPMCAEAVERRALSRRLARAAFQLIPNFALNLAPQADRRAIVEECAKVADEMGRAAYERGRFYRDLQASEAHKHCAAAIRALAPPVEEAGKERDDG